jgi:hypothetical protein
MCVCAYIYIYTYIYIMYLLHIYIGVPTDVSGPAMKDVLFENELSLFVTPRRDLFLSVSLSLTLSEEEKERESKRRQTARDVCLLILHLFCLGSGFCLTVLPHQHLKPRVR